MNTQLMGRLSSILIALTVAVASSVVEAGKAYGGSDRGYGTGNVAIPGVGPATGTWQQAGDNNQYSYQYQNRHREHNGDTNWTMDSADSGKGQYSNDKYLNQRDFQAWLYQNLEQTNSQIQNQERVESMAQDGF